MVNTDAEAKYTKAIKAAYRDNQTLDRAKAYLTRAHNNSTMIVVEAGLSMEGTEVSSVEYMASANLQVRCRDKSKDIDMDNLSISMEALFVNGRMQTWLLAWKLMSNIHFL